MRENDYTGSPIEDNDQLSLMEELGIFELDDYDDIPEYEVDENETVIDPGAYINGASSLREIAERMYDFAEELLAMAAEGWEVVDNASNGRASAIRLSDETEYDDE